MSKITCYIVDDQFDSVERLEYLLQQCDDIEITGKSTQSADALNEILKLKPQLVFIDAEMPELTGFELINRVREKNVYPKFVFTTGYSQYAIKAIKSEAFDYLLKPIDIDELKQTLARVSNANSINKQFTNLKLSLRESEILKLILKGKTSQQIADELFISKNTVDTHRRNILEKNGLKNTQELLLQAAKYF